MPNPAILIKDDEKFKWGPFKKVDKKGVEIGDATGVTASTGDSNLLTSVDNTDGTFSFLGGTPVVGGSQVQAIVTDDAGKTGVVDVTVMPGDEASVAGAVGAPEPQ
jgi:hypothetical protein